MQQFFTMNKYLRVLVATRRAKQLEKGARPLVHVDSQKRTRIARQEVQEGLIGFEFDSVTQDDEVIHQSR